MLSMGAEMLALMIRQQMDGDPGWDPVLRHMARGLEAIAVKKEDYAYYPDGGFGAAFVYPKSGWRRTDEPGGEHEGGEGSVLAYQGYQLRALSLWASRSGDEQALEFAGRLARFIMKPKFWGGVTDPVLTAGQERGHVDSHFHARAIAQRGLLEYGLVAGDAAACEFVRSSYEYMRSFGIPEIGFIPTFPDASHAHYHYIEGCFLGDWVALALKLSEGGYGDYWEDVDRMARNHLVEGQLVDRELLARVVARSPEYAPKPDAMPGQEYASEEVVDRVRGAYPNFVGVNSVDRMWTAGCCTGNGTSGIYYAWDGITRCSGDNAQVNLLLNRASPWLDINSYLPYEGRVTIINKTARRLSVRMPPWVAHSRLECRFNDAPCRALWLGNYAVLDDLSPGDVVDLRFPVPEQTITRTAHAQKPDETVYTIVMRGNTAVSISPRDESPSSYPMYLRDHMKGNEAPTRMVQRFVSQVLPRW